jgi:DNA-binding transcriptional MerR regulator
MIKLYDKFEVAEIIGCSPNTIKFWAAKKGIGIKKKGFRVFLDEHVQEFKKIITIGKEKKK